MSSAVTQIRAMVEDEDTYAKNYRDLRPLQIAAVNEHLATMRERIPLLDRRAKEAGLTAASTLSDFLPVLLPHSVYKSYPHSMLLKGQWDKLFAWLKTVAAIPTAKVDFSGVTNLDEWLERLNQIGQHVGITSGTSGKPSLLNANSSDHDRIRYMSRYASFIDNKPKAEPRWHYFTVAPRKGPYAMIVMSTALAECFGRPDSIHYLSDEPLTTSQVIRATTMRNRIADGSASPQEIADFEAEAKLRQTEMGANMQRMADTMASLRHEPIWMSGTWPQLWLVVNLLRDRVKAGDFHPESIIVGGGGKKGAVMPDDYEDQVATFFGVPRRSTFGMSEMAGALRGCEANRFHAMPQIVMILLDDTGDNVVEPKGVVTGRFAFIDLLWEGRWGGLITGDRVTVDHSETCPCGRPGPTVLSNIVRYKDIGDDKIGCAGTLDAYITGVLN